MAYQYSFQWYQMGKGMAQAIVLLLLVVIASTVLLRRLWNRMAASVAQVTTRRAVEPHYLRNVAIMMAAIVLLLWTVFPFIWILLTSLKTANDILSVPPKFVFSPTISNYMALVIGEQRGAYASSRPDFPLFFLNSMIISFGAVALSDPAAIPAAYALARFDFPFKNALAFLFLSFRFVPFIAFVIPLYLLFQKFGLYNTHLGLILAYQLITLPFTIWMLRSFLYGNPPGDPGCGKDRRLFMARRAHPGDSAAEHARSRRDDHPWVHVQLERLQLSADGWLAARLSRSRLAPSSSYPMSRCCGGRWPRRQSSLPSRSWCLVLWCKSISCAG